MHSEEKIQEIIAKLAGIEGQLDNLRLQMARFESDRTSEKGTIAREHVRLQKEIDKLYKEFMSVVFDREKGIAFELDRLKEKDKKRDEGKKVIWGLAIAVIGIIIKMIFEWVATK